MSIVMFIIHESNNQGSHLIVPEWMSRIKTMSKQHTQEVVKQKEIQILNAKPPLKKQTDKIAEVLLESLDPEENEEEEDEEKKETKESIKIKEPKLASKANTIDSKPSNAFTEPQPTPQPLHALLHDDNAEFQGGETEKKGTLVCHGKEVESEVIYWRKVKGDRHYESPITPHHE